MKYSEDFLKGSLKKIISLIENGLALPSVIRMHEKIIEIAKKWNCEPWKLNGLFLELAGLLDEVPMPVNKHDIVWLESKSVLELFNVLDLDKGIVEDILPFIKEMNAMDGKDN